MSVRGKLSVLWDIMYYAAADGPMGPLTSRVLQDEPSTIVDGVGDGGRATEVIYSGERPLGTTLADVWDFVHASGVNVTYNGGAAEYVEDPGHEVVIPVTAVSKLKGIYIRHLTSSATNSISVVGTLLGGANLPFLLATDGINIRPGGEVFFYAPYGGYLLTAGADTITITNLGAANVDYEAFFLFASA